MANWALSPLTVGSGFQITRIFAFVVAGAVTSDQETRPSLAVSTMIGVQVAPPSRESCTSTFPPPARTTLPDQEIETRLPISSSCPPFGEISLIEGSRIWNVLLLTSDTPDASSAVMRTSAFEVGGPGTVQLTLPVFGVLSKAVW